MNINSQEHIKLIAPDVAKAYQLGKEQKYDEAYQTLLPLFEAKEISVKGNIDKEKSTQWNGTFLISLHAGEKIQDLLKGLDAAEVSDPMVLRYTMNLCKKYIMKVKSQTLDYEDSRTSQLSELLLSVHKFMCANKGGSEYLSMILDKEV